MTTQEETAMTNSISTIGALDQPERLSSSERLQISWALVWPGALYSATYFVVRSQLHLSAVHLEAIDQVVGLLVFFLFSTWVVRRTVRMNFPGFRLLVVRRDAAEGARRMSYRESLSVAWLIGWRLAAILSAIAVAITLGAGIAFGFASCWRPDLKESPLIDLCTAPAEFLILYVCLVKATVNKTYAHFSLRVDRSVPSN
jgi:hypothetical protein